MSGSPPEPLDVLSACYTEDLTASSTDADLAAIAERIATEHHRNIDNITEFLTWLRARARHRVRREATEAGELVAKLEAELRAARAARADLVTQVIGFREQPEWEGGGLNYAAVGRLAAMSRQGAAAAFQQPTTTTRSESQPA